VSRVRREDGQTSLLIVGFFLVALLMVVVVVDASAAYLRRQSLDSVADGAALAAADGVQGERVYRGGLGERAEIDPAVARRYVAEYLAAVGAHSRYPGIGYSVQTTSDAVAVRVTAPLDLPFAPPGWKSETTVTGTAASYVVVAD
jgi:hypothetical protein